MKLQPVSTSSNKTLVVVSCGKAKVWDRYPDAGPIKANEAYVSSLFKLCRRFAENQRGAQWTILSAKHGFLEPTTAITAYNVAFSKNADAIGMDVLRAQWAQ